MLKGPFENLIENPGFFEFPKVDIYHFIKQLIKIKSYSTLKNFKIITSIFKIIFQNLS